MVAPTRGEGREILRALARHRGRWLGIEVTTVRPLALELVGADLASAGLALLDEFAEQALVDELLDEVLEAATDARHIHELAEGAGFRTAVRKAIVALRLAGVDADRLAKAPFGDQRKGDVLSALYSRYLEHLARGRRVDTADVLIRAAEATRMGAPLPGDVVLLLPGLGTRGLAGRFLTALQSRGARCLPTDPVAGVTPPNGMLWNAGSAPAPPLEPELFRAAGITEELREMLRRVLAWGHRWDEIEIVTPDPGVYGPALHALAERLGVPVTFAVGLPFERTRAGRVVATYLRWLHDSFPDATIRRLLETGDLASPPPYADVDGPRLARALQRLRVGWGRDRYLPAIASARRRLVERPPRPHADEEPAATAARCERELRELDALRALIEPIERSVPPVHGRVDAEPTLVAPGALARGLATFLEHVPEGGAVDQTALERLRQILDRAAATLTRPTTLAGALAALAEHLAIRVPAPRAEGRAPWGSHGGHLHLADVEHGGWTGRSVTFVVGLDAARFPGSGAQDPILLDAERGALAARDLPSSAQRLEERRFRMAALLARLRGRVTLSYAAWEPSEGRTLIPSPLLLQLFRQRERLPAAGFEELERHLGDPVSRIPGGRTRLDAEDVWLGALADGGRLRDGEATVRAAFPWLDAGLRARAARSSDPPGPHHGLLRARPGLDPRADRAITLSSRRLEALGTCPLRYFYAYVLGIRPPDDPSFNPERWLDQLRRGSLLHAVYERTLTAARTKGISPSDPSFVDLALQLLAEEADTMRLAVPPPSTAVYERELAELATEVRSFAGMVRDDLPQWEATELRFGFGDAEHPPVELPLPSGRAIRLRGAIDRVDALPSNELRVVDYKTGSPTFFSRTTVWNGGRRLQHLLYTEAIERLLRRRVSRMEYHFPTRKGENDRSCFPRDDLRDGPALVDRLLDLVESGRFLPTERVGDCRWCDFRAPCRVRENPWGDTESPLASWADTHFEHEAYAPFQLVRLFRDRGGTKR